MSNAFRTGTICSPFITTLTTQGEKWGKFGYQALKTGRRLTVGRTEGISTEESDRIQVLESIQAGLETSSSSHWLFVPAFNVVDVVEVENGEGVVFLRCWQAGAGSRRRAESGGTMEKAGRAVRRRVMIIVTAYNAALSYASTHCLSVCSASANLEQREATTIMTLGTHSP